MNRMFFSDGAAAGSKNETSKKGGPNQRADCAGSQKKWWSAKFKGEGPEKNGKEEAGRYKN